MSRGISRHDEIMKYIKAFQTKNFRMPTRKEVMYDLKIGRGVLQRAIDRLVKKGRLERLPREIMEFRIKW